MASRSDNLPGKTDWFLRLDSGNQNNSPMAEILTALNFCKMWDDYNNLAKRLEKLTVQFGELFGNDSSRVDQLFRYASNKEQGGKDALLEFKIEEVLKESGPEN